MDAIASFSFKLNPVAKERARITRRGRCYTPIKTKTFENSLKRKFTVEWMKELIDYPVAVHVVFTIARPKSVKRKYPSVRPDTDNYLKSLLDSMNGTVLVDDALVCNIVAVKQYGRWGSIDLKVYALT